MEIPGWSISRNGARMKVSARGASVLSWTVPTLDGQPVELLDGYQDRDESQVGDGNRQALLVPWTGVASSKPFQWQGDTVNLGDGVDGLVYAKEFDLVEESASWVQIRAFADRQDYPSTLRVDVRFSLPPTSPVGGHSMDIHCTVTNVGDQDAPVSLGWRPWLRMLGGVEGTRLTLPVQCRVVRGLQGVPLSYQPEPRVVSDVGVVLDSPRRIHQTWSCLNTDHGVATVVMDHAAGGHTFLQISHEHDNEHQPTPGAGVIHVNTGEELHHRSGQALCVAYSQVPEGVFGRDEFYDMLNLPVGHTRSLRIRLVYVP